MQKNILFIMTDQQRFDSLSCYGCEAIQTPNLDRLAHQGVRFTQCYVNNPICTPSRASIFTGKPLPGHGVYRLHDDLPETEVPFPWRLKQLGYRTALFGKLHLSSRVFEQDNRHPYDGFDVYEESKSPYLPPSRLNAYLPWLESNLPDIYQDLQEKKRMLGHFPEEAHLSRWISTRTIDFLESHDRDTPFFCYSSFFDPHDPYNDYPKRMESLVNTQSLPKPIPEPDDWACVPEELRREHDHGYLGAYDSYTEADIAQMRTGYLASVAFVDEEVGRILDKLEELGYAEDTVVIFTSDHGDNLGDHGLLGKGAFFYEPCVKVPLIIRSPSESAQGTVYNQIVQGHDIAATILGVAGMREEDVAVEMPESVNLFEQVRRPEMFADRAAVCLYRGTSICDTKLYFDPQINAGMYRKGQHKLVVYFSTSPSSSAPAGQLFNIDLDPTEIDDLWDDPAHAETRNKLLLDFTCEVNNMDLRYNGSRGGSHFPPKTHWSQNNPI